jgi:hypothetical protein
MNFICGLCLWFKRRGDEELKESKKYGEDWEFWCHYNNPPEVSDPYNFCHNFKCLYCYGDCEDEVDHFDCMEECVCEECKKQKQKQRLNVVE